MNITERTSQISERLDSISDYREQCKRLTAELTSAINSVLRPEPTEKPMVEATLSDVPKQPLAPLAERLRCEERELYELRDKLASLINQIEL